MKKFELDLIPEKLFQEALEALDDALPRLDSYYKTKNVKDIKLSVLQLHRFVEYILKYFVSEINPILVFDKPFEKINLNNFKTISCEKAFNFYINNLEFDLIDPPFEYQKEDFRLRFKYFKDLRNQINHWFISTSELKDVDIELTSLFQIIYYICLEHNIFDKIKNSLSKEKQEILKELIDKERLKIRRAYEKVEKYYAERNPSDAKEANDHNTPVFMCPQCNENTFILSKNDENFECTNCQYDSPCGHCNVQLSCSSKYTPHSYLSEWNSEYESFICEDCMDEINHRVNKD